MRFSLQDMVQQTLAEAERRESVKLASAGEGKDPKEEEKKQKQGPPAAKTPPDNTNTSPERNEDSYEEKTSSAFVEKLAGAAEYLNEHFLKVAVGKPEPALSHGTPGTAQGIGPGSGTGTLALNTPTPGMQSEETGQASTGQIPTNPPKDPKSPGQTNTATALQTTIQDPPGGQEDWTNKDVLKQAAAHVRGLMRKHANQDQVSRVRAIMDKMAADSVDPASVGAKVTNPHQSSPPGVSASEQGPKPSQPGEATKQESMINSNQAAIDYTKQQAKAVPKARMGEVLSEPAQKKSTDPVLHNNLDAASSAGVKLSSVTKAAAARALLRKVAEEGASDDASPEQKERAAKLQAVLQSKQQEKQKASMGTMPVGGGY